MTQDQNAKPVEKKKGFIAKWFDSLDKKMAEKAKSTGCCSSDKSKGGKCC